MKEYDLSVIIKPRLRMTYKDCIRNKPWLRVCNINNICARMLESTNGNVFIVFNKIQQNYELHTVEAQRLSGDSYNASIPQEFLNQFIINDYKLTDMAKNLDDILSKRFEAEAFKKNWENAKRDESLNEQLKIIGRVIGTKI